MRWSERQRAMLQVIGIRPVAGRRRPRARRMRAPQAPGRTEVSKGARRPPRAHPGGRAVTEPAIAAAPSAPAATGRRRSRRRADVATLGWRESA